MKGNLSSRILSKSNQFNYYKNLSEDLANRNKNLNSEIKRLRNKLNNSKFNNFKDMLANSYCNPIIKAPFTDNDIEYFSFMDYVGTYLRLNLNNQKPLVSVIMPVYNREDIVKKSVDSVLNQTYKNLELIIVDDGSTDNTIKIIDSINDERIRFIKHSKNQGVCISRNNGLELSKGEYIFYLDSDNTWKPEYIETMIGAYLELPDADALYCGQYVADTDKSPIRMVRFGLLNKSLFHNRNYIDLNCFTHKKEIFNKIGGFRESLKRLNDYEYIHSILDNGFKIYSIPVLLSNYYMHNSDNRIGHMDYYPIDEVRNLHSKYILDIKDNHLEINYTNVKDNSKELKNNINIIVFADNEITNIEDCLNPLLNHDNFDKLHITALYGGDNPDIFQYLNSLSSDNLINYIKTDITYDNLEGIQKIVNSLDNNFDIIFLKSSAIITKGSIELFEEYANKLADSGILISRKIALNNYNHLKEHVPYAYSDEYCDIAVSAKYKNIINPPLFYSDEYLELDFTKFFCLYIKREVFDDSVGKNIHLKSFNDKNFYSYIRFFLNKKIYLISEGDVFYKDDRFSSRNDSSDL